MCIVLDDVAHIVEKKLNFLLTSLLVKQFYTIFSINFWFLLRKIY